MRYFITQGQLHSIIYNYLDEKLENVTTDKITNPINPNAYRIEMGDDLITYFYYGPGEDDDGNIHYGVGMLHIHPDIVDTLRQLINIRQSKVVDIVADWFSEKFEVDIDETSIYPNRKKPPVY
jgi:hypothetical protein